MGVHGLWRLIEPSGKPIPLETLENKVLAVDVSIWLHQAIKGFQDSRGAPIPNAHLLGIYHRICKLLYFRIKPVFVFDGGVPVLKKQTIANRNQQKTKNLNEADQLHQQLLNTLLKHAAVSKVLGEKDTTSEVSSTVKKLTTEDMFMLPPTELDSTISSSSDEETVSITRSSTTPKHWDLHNIDTKSPHFKSLPADVRHEILTELKETRKQSSWGRLHELPKQSDDFSTFQMGRLLKRQAVQTALEVAEKEMGGHSLSLAELEAIMKDQGVLTDGKFGSRIASDENTRYLLIKNVKEAMEKAKTEEDAAEAVRKLVEECDKEEPEKEPIKNTNKADQEFEEDLETAIALSMQEVPSTSRVSDSSFEMESSYVTDSEEECVEPSREHYKDNKIAFSSARSYMMEYTGLTANAIGEILGSNSNKANKNVKTVLNKKIAGKVVVESISSESDSDFEEIKTDDSNVTTNLDAQNEKVNETSSESGEFEEVEENLEKSDAKDDIKNLQIVIDVNYEPEDDLFSDIFKEEVNEEVKCSIKEIPMEEVQDNNQLILENSRNVEKPTELALPEENIVENDLSIPDSSKSNVKPVEAPPEEPKISVQQMKELKMDLEKESRSLTEEKSSKERLAGNITDQMCQEAQELLKLFGVPYVVAPMEAEAQCAYLDEINLTDGSITDDSDIWLFGGKTVYKNFFNHAKQVMEFNVENIVHHFKLTREQMILLAMLVGSDYTVGLQGVGPVTALEILAAFPPSKKQGHEFNLSHAQLVSGLREFRKWFRQGCGPGPGRTALKSKLKNVNFTENFPSLQVVNAYLDPKVDTSKEAFTWAKPDIVGLIEFARVKFGWTKKKSEEILNPLVRRLDDGRIQKTIKDFFKTTLRVDSGEAESKMSKRVQKAIHRLNRDPNEEETVEEKKPRKRQNKKKVVTEVPAGLEDDEDVKVLLETASTSAVKEEQIEEDVKRQLKNTAQKLVKNLHKKEVIHQKEREKSATLKRKLKAIEVFRKSKQGPGFVKKRQQGKMVPKEDAGLSESESE